VNALDRRHPSQRVYHRNVRVAMTAAVAAHAAVLAFVPVPLPALRPAVPEVLRVVEMSGVLIPGARNAGQEARSPELRPSPAAPAGGMTADPLRAVDEPAQMVPASEVPKGGAPAAGPGSGPAGIAGEARADDAPEVFYAYDTAPRAVLRAEPVYPPEARAAGHDGTVVVNLNIDERGRILRAWVAESSAPDVLVAAAMDAAYRFEFEPGTWRGAPVRCTVAIPFQFHLTQTLETEGR
jgi:periplasmic protein TonB